MAVTFEEAKAKATKALEYLKTCDDYSTEEAYEAIYYLDGDVPADDYDTCFELGQYLAKQGIVSLMVEMVRSLKLYDGKNLEQKHANLIEVLGFCTNLTSDTKLKEVALDFVKHGAIGLLLSMLDPSKHPDTESELIQTIRILNMLNNCVIYPESIVRRTYRESNAVPVLMGYLNSTQIVMQIKSFPVLAYIVNDKESDVIASTEYCIEQMIDMLKIAAQDGLVYYSVSGRSYTSGLHGLIGTTNRLAVNDASKREIVKHGGVPIITQIITDEEVTTKTKQYAIETLWKLAFVDSHRKEISKHLKDTNTVEVLKELQKSEYPALREASTGLLWKLDIIDVHDDGNQAKPQNPPTSSEEAVVPPQIFISFSWENNQDQVKKLRDGLQGAGFSVWMDVDKMSGNTLKAMADAVDKASLVLVCASPVYHASVNCQQEATYSFDKKKPIIPILMEDNYEPDGWLGLLTAGKLFFKVYTDEMLESQMPAIIGEIKRLAPAL